MAFEVNFKYRKARDKWKLKEINKWEAYDLVKQSKIIKTLLLSVLFLLLRKKWQPTAVLLPGKSHGWKSLADYNPWGRKELDTSERLHLHLHGVFRTKKIQMSTEVLQVRCVYCVLRCFSRVWLCKSWTIAHQALLSSEFSRQNIGVGCHGPFSRGSSWSRDWTWVS